MSGDWQRKTSTCYTTQHNMLALNNIIRCYHLGMTSSRTTFTLDQDLAEKARQLGINISAAARRGVTDAVREALVQADRDAYTRQPERADAFWADAEAWEEY